MTISGGDRGFGGGLLGVPLGAFFLPRQMGWLCADCGGGLVLGVCGALLSEVSEAGH